MAKTRNLQWKRLPNDEAFKFIAAVASADEPAIFNPTLCEVYATPLPFYDGYSLVRIVNRHMLPYLLLDYLSNGENHHYLDGSDRAFQNLNIQGAISLDETNVMSYGDMYISYVYERGNSLAFISDPHNTQYKGSAAMDIHFKAISHHSGSTATYDESSRCFDIICPLIYQDGTVQGRLRVEKTGAIHVIEPLAVSFLTAPRASPSIEYRHPAEQKITEQARNLLTGTPRGERLFRAAGEIPFEVRVMASPNYQGFTTNDRVVYIVMPAPQESADYLQALLLAGGLRDLEQMGEKLYHPHPDIEEELYALMNYGKNLDIILEMCKIVEEFEARNIPEPLHELRKMGFESLYVAQKNGADEKALMATYRDTLRRYGFIQG